MNQAVAYARVILCKVYDFVRHAASRNSAPDRIRHNETPAGQLVPASAWWEDVYAQLGNFLLSPATQVVDGLWLGGALNAHDRAFLQEARVRAVVNLTREVPNLHVPHLTHCQVQACDEVGCQLPLRWLVRFIRAQRRAGRVVLVHCFVGRSRSVAVVCAYLMAEWGCSFEHAYAHVSRVRPAACISCDLMRQLREAELPEPELRRQRG